MGTIQILCPTCAAMFSVPEEFVNKRARCKHCGQAFVIKVPDLEDTVAGWLSEELAEAEQKAAEKAAAEKAFSPAAPPPVSAAATPGPSAQQPGAAGPIDTSAPPPQEGLRLSHVDALGAFFLFPPSLLTDPGFRSSIPRCCLGCGSTHNLRVHIVRWQSVRNEPKQKRDDEPAPATVGGKNLVGLPDKQLLEALPAAPNMPPPYNLPIPYFICNRCSPVGAIMTHVRPDAYGREVCEIGVSSLKRAAQFLARNLGRDHEDFKRLDSEIKSGRANPWNSLPLAVRNRIVRWYKAGDDERFVSYIRDTDFAKAEAGQGGLVITDKRMVYQKYASHREILLSDPIEIIVANSHGKYQITVSSPKTKPAIIHGDATVTEMIRNTLNTLDVDYTIKT